MDSPPLPELARICADLEELTGESYGVRELARDIQELGESRSLSRIRAALRQPSPPGWARRRAARVRAFALLRGRRPIRRLELPHLRDVVDDIPAADSTL